MTAKRKRSIRGKLTWIIMITSTTAVLLTCLGFTASGIMNLRKRLVADLSTIARVVGSNSTAALTFGDRQGAREVLYGLRAKPSIIAAAIYTKSGQPFARYEPNASIFIPPAVLEDGFHDGDNRLGLFYPIELDHQRLGTLYIATDTRDRDNRLKQYGEIAVGIVLFSLVVAFILATRLQSAISGPIAELARVAALVSHDRAFSVRASHPALEDNDEIGNLMTGFNSMLAEIEQRDDRLLMIQTHLENTVACRTEELTLANEELLLAKNEAERIAEINARLARESALILNSATDGIIGVGMHSNVSFLNPASARMLGRSISDFEGKSFHELIHHSRADGTPFPSADCPLGRAVRSGQPFPLTVDVFWRSDGSNFPAEYSAMPMSEQGENIGAVVTFRDITERRAIERLKGEFVSTVSHELRTPLTSIRGALGLLSSGLLGPIAEKGQRMLEIAVSNTDRLVRLINDILDLERIGSGKVEIARGPVDANAVMVQALEGLQSMADEAGVHLTNTPAIGALWGDADRIIQTLTNLLGNAIKFSPSGTTVTLSGEASETSFVFCVADQGRGVPKEKLETIFGRFSQVDASDSRDKGGSGLGLAICKSIVTAHGGRIWAEANHPAGSRFQFTIPLAVSAVATPAIESPESAIHVLHEDAAPSVLIVEDDLDLAGVISTALRGHGITTIHVVSGREAIQSCAEHVPSLIVLDLGLPDMDGFAVVSSLRESAALGQLPLLIYSAEDVGSGDQSRLRLGTTEFLTKSRCSLGDFERHVLRLLKTVTTTRKEELHAA